DAGFVEPDTGCVRDAAYRHKQVAAFNLLFASSRAHGHRYRIAGKSIDTDRSSAQHYLDRFAAQNALDLFSDIGIFPSHELATGLDDRHPAADSSKSLRRLDTDIAAAEDD